nr:hypothetical protein BaRGS_009140 [Batillaria attramentaria]
MSTPITGKTKTTVAERLSPMSAGSGREDSASVQGLERGDRLQLWLEEAKAVAASLKLHGEALSKFIADELRSRRAEERESRLKEQLQCGELKLKVERHQEELRRENERHQEELRREGERQQEEIWRQREELRLKEDRQREELRLQEEETRLKLKRRGSPVPSPAVGTLNLKLPAFDEEKEDLDTFLGRIERGPTAEVAGRYLGRAHRRTARSSRWKYDRNNRSTTKGSTEKSSHYKRECPERKAKERLTVITLATRDDVKVCSTALVQVESPFYCGEVHAIVMPNLTVPMILGNYAERRDGTLVPLPVLRETALVLTRAGAAKERGGMRPLKVTDSELGTVTREELVRLQQDDPSLARTRNLAAAGTTKPSGKQGRVRFLWRKGVLQREYTGPSGTFYQICVPERLRPGLLRLSHDVPMAGHLGCKKTQDRLQPGFYWPAQASDVRRYVASCDACQRTVPRGRIGKVPLGKHPLIDKPFRRVGVDLVGPIIPASDRKNRYILVARLIRGKWTQDSDEEVKTTVQYVLDLRERLEAMIEFCCCKRNKLEMAWQGPYEVVERAGEADYRIRVGDRIKLFHANLLKAYQERDRVQDPPPPAPRVRTRVALVVDESLEEDAPGRSDELPVPVLTPEEGPTDVSLNPELPPGQREKILRVCISEGNDQTAERGAATGVGYSSLDREHPTAMEDCCA